MSDLIKRLDDARSSYSMSRIRGLAAEAANEITTLRQQLAKSEARVAELAAKAHNLSFGIVNSLTDEQQEPFAKQFAELQDCIAAQSSEPFILRKQAEKLEEVARLVKEGSEAGLSTVASIYEGLLLNVTSLRDEADEAERAN